MVQKTVNTEVKAGQKSSIMVRDLDIYCLRSHRSSNSIASKVQTQGIITKDFSRPEELKAKEIKSVYANVAEPSKPAKKENKQKGLNIDRNALENQKKSRPLVTMLSMPPKRIWRRSVTLIKSRTSIAIRKVTMPATTPSQKTSVGLGNFRANDW